MLSQKFYRIPAPTTPLFTVEADGECHMFTAGIKRSASGVVEVYDGQDLAYVLSPCEWAAFRASGKVQTGDVLLERV